MTSSEVAARLGVTVGRVRQLAQAGTLPATKVGRDWVFKRGDIEDFASTPRTGRGRPRKPS